MVNLKANQAIIDQNDRTLGNLIGKFFVVKGEALGIARNTGIGSNDNFAACLEHDFLMILEFSCTNLGTFGVKHDGNRQTQLAGNIANTLNILTVIFMATMAEVKASNVHAVDNELTKNIVAFSSRTHGANNFSTLIHRTPIIKPTAMLI